MTLIDSQVHVYEHDSAERPWRTRPNWLAHATGEEVIATMDAIGVDGAILVSPFAMYGYDASHSVEACRQYPGRFAVIKPVDPSDPAVEDVVVEWKHTPGAVGIRLFMDKHSGRDPADPAVARIARTAARLDLPINLHCWDNIGAATTLIDRHPETRFVIDHLATVQPFALPVPSSAWSELPQVIELAKRPNAVVKVSGACTLSRECYPFADIWTPLAKILEAWGIERCLWGTDWTRAIAVVSYKPAVDAFRFTDRLTEAEKAMLMGQACARVYGWSPKVA